MTSVVEILVFLPNSLVIALFSAVGLTVSLVGYAFPISNMITAEKNRRRGKTNSVQADIDEHMEWLKKRLQEIESQISSAIA